jgi:hypothetical protein
MTKICKELTDVMAAAVRKRLPNMIACDLVGVAEVMFYEWRNHGDEDIKNGIDSEYAYFSKTIKKAQSEAIQESLERINAAARDPKQWTADAWLLERCHRKYFSLHGDQVEKLEERVKQLEGKTNE